MAARTMWKAEVCLGDERVPVRMYAAVEDRGVHFRLLHAADMAPVKQRMVDPQDGEPVEPEAMQRGVQVDRDHFVVLSEQERAALAPEPSRAIVVEQVVDRAQVAWRWFDRPYYLGPDKDANGDASYFALARALEDRAVMAIARWTMRKKRYAGALYARDGYLVLETMRPAEHMVPLERLRLDPARKPEPRERKLAEQLVSALQGELDPAAYKSEYRERLMRLIEDKAAGREVSLPAPRAKRPPSSLTDALEASLAQRKVANG